MSYTTVAEVQGLIAGFTIGVSSRVTTTQVQTMIDGTSAEIDAVLGGIGVVVPVASPSWFVTRLAALNSYGTAAGVLKSAYPETVGPGENPAYAFWEARYREGLKALRAGQDLPAELLSSGVDAGLSPSGYFTRNPDEEEELGDLEGASWFKVSKEF